MLQRKNILIKADPERVLLQFFFPGSGRRVENILNRISLLNDDEVKNLWEKVCGKFSSRHRNFEEVLQSNYSKIEKYVSSKKSITRERKLLIGSYFSKEYSIASAALFNPSIVLHPDQSRLNKGEVRFILSLRATGEGHISSIEFRTGIVDAAGEIKINNAGRFITSGKYIQGKGSVLYEIEFDQFTKITERVIFPNHPSESNGIEDARFVLFTDADGAKKYFATYTAYDGKKISINIIETNDFVSFKIHKLSGEASSDKGMALFPEKIDNHYYMISRQDGENLFIMKSENLFKWNNKELLYSPKNSWEYVQVGNCGSPIKTEKGWILFTHSVGTLRTYVISAMLLDLKNPGKIIGHLTEPLIEPNETEREGYVPNVVYSCGSLLHKENIIIPYAMSDSASSFAVIKKKDLLKRFIIY